MNLKTQPSLHPSTRILIVDDEPALVELIVLTLKRMQIESDTASTLSAARAALLLGRYALCLLDLKLPDGDGMDLVEWIQKEMPETPVAVLTAHASIEVAVRALKLGAFDFLTKPVDLTVLRQLVTGAIRLASGTPETPSGLIGVSPAIEDLKTMIARVARNQAPVHIHGETGTGKELVSRLIHTSGSRRDHPFVPINCGAIPSELLESEFFGHKRGAFTGAVADQLGLIRSAEGGTLFLDEIAELPLSMQVKLLRFIQEKSVRPVGIAQEVPVDVRIISASHKNLRDEVAQGRFREDLFYRLVVIELYVPPLRERLSDLALLAQAIVTRLVLGRPVTFAPCTFERLMAYDYPGNVRELENILERALTLADGDLIRPDDIRVRRSQRSQAPERAPDRPLPDYLDDLEREQMRQALRECRGNKTEAAKRLGISFRQFRYRMKKLGLG
ncbi:type 4 fimbriae expression regulatory protein pilR [mine drainage metagenome]|uniref:Type 4 fimbriae expression regulatory protein pilR n=2 Tax=mine drainage metagenome TaxID=410659 RepID=T0ZU35_9ZZZZ